MYSQILTVSPALLRELSRMRSRAALFTAYASVGSSAEQIDAALNWALESAQGPRLTQMHVRAVLAHLGETLCARASDSTPAIRSVACFADIDGSAQDDIWVAFPVHIPLQACVRSTLDLTPFVGALDRMHLDHAPNDELQSLLDSSARRVLVGAC